MPSLFEAFEIEVGPTTLEQLSEDVLSELLSLARQQEGIGNLPHVFNPAELRQTYLQKVLEVSQKRGVFTYICARCMKPIGDHKKIVFDTRLGLIYGKECYDIIMTKQHNLQYHYNSDGSRVSATSEEMMTFKCFTSGFEFRAVINNVGKCGATPRACAMCPGTGLKFKGLPCDFERWAAQRKG